MNNYHIYEEIGRGKYSVVYKVITIFLSHLGQDQKDYKVCCSQKCWKVEKTQSYERS